MSMAYGPLLTALRGRKWVLAPHCVETMTPGVKVNLFEVPGGYAVPVTFGGKLESAALTLRNLPGLDRLKAAVLHPGTDSATAVNGRHNEGLLELTVPLKRGCAMVQLILPK
jgi:hypothetical protein